MVGVPKHFNTKKDVLLCHTLALKGEFDRNEVKKKLQNLLSDEKVWAYEREVTEDYTAGENEKVIVEEDIDTGQIRHSLYVLKDNPYAYYSRLGFKKEELQSLIDQL